MVLEQILRHFEEVAYSTPCRPDRLINTISTEFSKSPASLKTFPILILQSTFQRKTITRFIKHYNLLSKILLNILRISNRTLESHKNNLIKDIIDYSEKCSKCVEKHFREGIAVFLRILKNHKITEFNSMETHVRVIIKRLIEDKDQKVRLAALQLAKLYSMKNEIFQVIRTDPNNDMRKSAIDWLKGDDKELILQDLTDCLEDNSENIKVKAICYFIKEQVWPNSEGLRCLFKIVMKNSNLIKSKAKELILKIIGQSDIITIFKHMNIFPGNGTDRELYLAISAGFSEIYLDRAGDLTKVIKTLFSRLLNEKEKIDLESLFVLRLSIKLYKDKNLSLQYLIDEYDLQSEFPRLIDFFLENTEQYKPYYYMKLQSILLITYIDLEEHASDILMSKYFKVCKEIPLLKYQPNKEIIEVSKELVLEMNEKLNHQKAVLAENEDDIIVTVVEIVREKFRDAERHYFLTLQDLVDSVMDGIQVEERENGVLKAPLQIKYEKAERKLRDNEENFVMAKQERSREAKNEEKELKSVSTKQEQKMDLLKKQIFEKRYRSLLVISYILQYAELNETLNPEYSTLTQNFFIGELTSENLYISTLALKCLGYSCLLSKDHSTQYIDQFLKRLKSKAEIVHLLAALHIFDILLCRKIEGSSKVLECINYLWKSLKDENSLISLNVLVEGFAKLLLKNLISSPIEIFIHLLELFFDNKTDIDTLNILQALFTNYIKISEEKANELITYYLVHIYISRRKPSLKLIGKVDEKIYKFSSIFDIKKTVPYERSENLQFVVLVFCFKFFDSNSKFFSKLLGGLSFEDFSLDAAKFAKSRMNELKISHSGYGKELDKMIAKLKLGTEIVEDISFREYEYRIKDIVSQAEGLEKEVIIID